MTNALQNLPPEMQERLAQIMAGQQITGNAPAAPVPAPPIVPQPQVGLTNPDLLATRPPSLMDHIIDLRGEIADMRNEVAQLMQQIDANSNVVDAVGQAVGTLYQMFQPSAQANAAGAAPRQGPTYSDTFTQSVEQDADY
tara:strand:+ start:6005 stop:6424 length:420 start_codon:yes stop_codon:yes gene_type:complete